MKKKECLIFFGPPGSGKSSLTQRLADRTDCQVIETGQLLRKKSGHGGELGRKIQSFMDKGDLVPSDLVYRVVRSEIGEHDHICFDGYPRDENQVEGFETLCREENLVRKCTVILNIPVETAFRRLSGRRICKNCKKIYNIYFDPPEQEGKCDACGGPLVQRKDDEPEIVERRLKKYEKRTKPVIAHYKAMEPERVFDIDADDDIESVFDRLLELIERRKCQSR